MTTALRKLRKQREKLLVCLTHRVALPVLLIIRKPKEFPYTLEQLHCFPHGTLGRELALFLSRNDLHLLKYYEKHDIKHVLLDYSSTEHGEVSLQFYMLGNGHISFPVFITVTFGLLCMPEYYGRFIKAWKRGKQSGNLKNVDWFALVPYQLTEIREEHNIINHLS